MFSGFIPQGAESYFERRLGAGVTAALFIHVAVLGYAAYASQGSEKAVVAELGDEPIEELPQEEEPPEEEPEEEIEEEPEPEPEEEPEPIEDPDPNPQPARQAEPQVQDVLPTELDKEDLEKSDDGPVGEVKAQDGAGTTGPVKTPAKKKPNNKPKGDGAKKKSGPKLEGDPNKPRKSAPEGATPAKPKKGNKAPEYPKPCKKRSIEGKYTLMLHIDRKGNVKAAKVVKKWNSAEGDDQKKAHKLFLKAIQAVVKTWKYTPAKYGNTTFAVWKRVSIPFKLKG
jgi:outer membrane biosynthesis protein TonB